jgi:ABC-type sugar transport system permease subunit
MKFNGFIPPKEERSPLWWTFILTTVIMLVTTVGGILLALYLALVVGPSDVPDSAELVAFLVGGK